MQQGWWQKDQGFLQRLVPVLPGMLGGPTEASGNPHGRGAVWPGNPRALCAQQMQQRGWSPPEEGWQGQGQQHGWGKGIPRLYLGPQTPGPRLWSTSWLPRGSSGNITTSEKSVFEIRSSPHTRRVPLPFYSKGLRVLVFILSKGVNFPEHFLLKPWCCIII